MSEKNYISGLLIKEVGNYGELSVSVKIDDFVEQLNKIANNGWANIKIAKNRNPTDKGYTHHCYENTWKPEKKEEKKRVKEEPDYTDDSQELPF